MNLIFAASSITYVVGFIPTWRRLFWTFNNSASYMDGFEVAGFTLGSAFLSLVWPISLPLWRLHTSVDGDWHQFAERVGTPPKKIRQENKVKKLEARNKELERQLNL